MMKAEGSGSVSLKIKTIYPVIPKGDKERKELEEDLGQLGLGGFLCRPWSLKDEEMIQELLSNQSNQWAKTNRALPGKWTVETWKKVYDFLRPGEGMASCTEKFAEGKFLNPPHSKDGYAVADCKIARERRMLEFIVPILYSEQPNRITVTWANTIFGALSGERKVF